MRLETYSEYKQIDHPWLESIPTHWTAKRFKFMAAIKNGRDHKHIEVETGGFPVIGSGGQFGYASGFLYDGESVLLGRKGTVDKPLYVSEPFWTVDTMFYTVIDLRFHVKYLYYCSLTIPFDRYLTSTALPSMTQEGLGNIAFAVPSLKEQQAIATFLDHETARIDILIEKQQKLIALLKEKRQAVISHAVTKGLDPTAPMKESGVEWLGEVPEHWIVTRVKFVTLRIIDGPHFSPKYVPDGYMFISARNIKVDGWSLDDAKYISESDYVDFSKRVKPEVGDVLLTKGGTTGIARTVDLAFPFQVWVHVAVLKPQHSVINPNYLSFALNSKGCYEQSQLYTRGATNHDLGLTRITNIRLALPPLDEQCNLVSQIDNKLEKIDRLLAKTDDFIGLLQERRTALISAAVTGKIDVRSHPAARAAA